MSRLHRALQRATDGKAPILPADTGVSADQSADGDQPAFSVPWILDATGREHPDPGAGSRTRPDAPWETARQPGFASAPAAARERHAVLEEKLVGGTLSEEQASLAVAIEQYRKLAATLHHAQAERGLQVIMVTSANPGEGKSLTASNLAITLAASYQRRVLLVDADLRRPSLHDLFGLPNTTGLSDGLAKESVDGLPVTEISGRLSVLPSGQPLDDPTAVLTSGQMKGVLDQARAAYDWVIIDTPPVGLLSDAKLLAEMVDGVVLIVEADKSPYPDILRAVEIIGRDKLLGAVLNRGLRGSGGVRYYKSYYGRPYAPRG